jgi:hypothetical protein
LAKPPPPSYSKLLQQVRKGQVKDLELRHVGETSHVLKLVLGEVQVKDGRMAIESGTSGNLILIEQEASQSWQRDGGKSCQLVLGEDQMLKVVQRLVSRCAQEVDGCDLVLSSLES